MRRGNGPDGHNGNDWRYRGSRGKHLYYKGSTRVYMGGWGGGAWNLKCWK